MTHSVPLVPEGAAFFPVPGSGMTRNYAFVLVPGFTLLAFASAAEPLRIAKQLSGPAPGPRQCDALLMAEGLGPSANSIPLLQKIGMAFQK